MYISQYLIADTHTLNADPVDRLIHVGAKPHPTNWHERIARRH